MKDKKMMRGLPGPQPLFAWAGACLLAGLVVLSGCGKDDPTTPDPPNPVGSISVSSSPTGAAIWLNGNNTGKVTNSALPNIAPGNYTVKLTMEGYRDFEQAVTVQASSTAQVNASMTPHFIRVTNPTADTIWIARKEAVIQWAVDPAGYAAGFADNPLTPDGLQKSDLSIAGITSVKVELFAAGGASLTLAASIPNSNELRWNVPLDMGGGKDYRVRVSAYGQQSVYGESPYFGICYNVDGTYKGFIKVTQGGQSTNIPVTYVQKQQGRNVTGSLTAADGSSGTTGGTIEQSKINVKVNLALNGMPYEFQGVMDIENFGDKLKLLLSGETAQGPATAELIVYRE